MRKLKDHQDVDAVRTMEELGKKFGTVMAIINHVVAQFGEQGVYEGNFEDVRLSLGKVGIHHYIYWCHFQGRPLHLRQGGRIQPQ